MGDRTPSGPEIIPAALRPAAGPLLTLALAVVIEALRTTALHLPGPSVVLLAAVAGSAYVGGFLAGGVSAVIAVGYTAWYYGPTPGRISADDLARLFDLAVAAAALVLMLGVLRRRAERARRLAADAAVAEEHRLIFEHAADAMFIAEPSGRYVYVNRRACEMTGYDRAELLRTRVGDLFPQPAPGPGGPPRVEPGAPYLERELVRRDGTRRRAELSVRRLPDGRTLKIARDVTAQREAMAELQRALSLVRATLESTADGILVVDRGGRWAGYNRKFLEIWGIPDDLAASGEDEAALEFVLAQLADPEAFLGRVRELYARPDESSRDEIRCRDGRVLERYSIPQRIGDTVIGRVWSFRDVSDVRRKEAALRENEHKFIQTQKLEAVGRLAGGVAHDFNNMLTAILGEADLLLNRDALEPGVRQQVTNMRNAALRGAQLTRQLLAFGRQQPNAPREFAPAELLSGIEPLIRRLAGRQVDVRLELPPGSEALHVNADPSQLEQAVLNLVINAGDAMPGGGTLVVSLGERHVARDEAAARGAPAAGEYACVSVADTGSGIPDEVRPHLFEPFFTTKPPGKGTGLGLASVHGIVQQAGGFVEVASAPGQGATFHVLLPRCGAPGEAAAAPVNGDGAHAARPDGPVSVLVVDDEDHVRGFVVTVLAHAGYEAVGAAGPREALALAGRRGGPFDLLLSDVLMPEGNGPALARAMLGDGSARRVMFMTGYPGRVFEGEMGGLERAPLLHKPFRSDELLQRVLVALEEPSRRA